MTSSSHPYTIPEGLTRSLSWVGPSLWTTPDKQRHSRERRRTFQALTGAYEHALPISDFEITTDRTVILSDVHKGDGRAGVDDFVHNERLYSAVLEFYLHGDYRLILNGDIEECWKASPRAVIDRYHSTAFALEREFARQGERRYVRIYGNHDNDWADPVQVQKHLWPALGGPVQVYPAALLGSRILIVHGHQGDLHADRWAWLSRRIVRYLWRPIQRLLRININRPVSHSMIHRLRDAFLSEWAGHTRLLMIAGHTHRPLFRPYSIGEQLAAIRERLVRQILAATDHRLRFKLLRTLENLEDAIDITAPAEPQRAAADPSSYYLNEGCCVHTDGITGIEIERGEIRLVKWSTPPSQSDESPSHPTRMVLSSADLAATLARL